MTIHCDRCGTKLDEPGAILLSPPDDAGMVRKFHLCRPCYGAIKPVVE